MTPRTDLTPRTPVYLDYDCRLMSAASKRLLPSRGETSDGALVYLGDHGDRFKNAPSALKRLRFPFYVFRAARVRLTQPWSLSAVQQRFHFG